MSSECPSPLAPKSNTLKVEETALSFLQGLPLVPLQLSKQETKEAMVMINVIIFLFIVFILRERYKVKGGRISIEEIFFS